MNVNIDPQILTILAVGVNVIVGLALAIWRNAFKELGNKLIRVEADSEKMLDKVNNLSERVGKIETVNDERLAQISDIHKHIIAMTSEMRAMREHYDEGIRRFFEDYELKKK